jgi:hypothetical protein
MDLPEIGWPGLTVHPLNLLDDEELAVLALFQEWRPSMAGRGHLPFAGGAADQPALVMDAIGIIEGAVQLLEKKPGE